DGGGVPAPGRKLGGPSVGAFDLDLEVREDVGDREEVDAGGHGHVTLPCPIGSTSLYRSGGPAPSANLHNVSTPPLHACPMLPSAARSRERGNDDGREAEVPNRLDFGPPPG